MYLVLVSIIAVFFCASPSYGSDQERSFNVAVFKLEPWGVRDEDGTVHGTLVDYLTLLEKESGLNFNYRYVPYSRMISELKSGKLDFSIFFSRPPSEQITKEIALTHIEEILIFTKKSRKYNNLNDLKNLRIAAPRGAKYGDWFDKNEDLTIYYTRDHGHSITMFEAGRVDGMIGPRSSLYYNAQKLGINLDQIASFLTMDIKNSVLHVSKVNIDKLPLALLEKSVTKLRLEGAFRNILIKYFGQGGVIQNPIIINR